MHRVAERIEDGRPLVGYRRVELPHVVFRHRDVIREASVAIDADDLHVLADIFLPGAAKQAGAARDVAFRRYAIARHDAAHRRPDLFNDAHKLVANDQRLLHPVLRPLIPSPDVSVGSADAGFANADKHVGRADRRQRNVFEGHARARRGLDQRAHGGGKRHGAIYDPSSCVASGLGPREAVPTIAAELRLAKRGRAGAAFGRSM